MTFRSSKSNQAAICPPFSHRRWWLQTVFFFILNDQQKAVNSYLCSIWLCRSGIKSNSTPFQHQTQMRKVGLIINIIISAGAIDLVESIQSKKEMA